MTTPSTRITTMITITSPAIARIISTTMAVAGDRDPGCFEIGVT